MSQLKSWFQKAVTTFLDPDRETRIANLVNAIQHGLHTHRQTFMIGPLVAAMQPVEADLLEAKRRVYRGALERGWADGDFTPKEQEIARWLANKLELSPAETRELNFEQARKSFGIALAQAMQDGVLDAQEQARLEAIANVVGCRISEFSRTFFQREGEAFLRSIFLACVADNHISDSDWQYLLHVTNTFGLQHHEMLAAVQPQAKQFVEHVLADAKSDGRISPQEIQTMQWLLQNLQLPQDFSKYVWNEIQHIQLIANIEEGRLPSVQMPMGMEQKSGEIVHWTGRAVWREMKNLKNGPKVIDHSGMLAVTDNRLIFSSTLKSHTLGFHKIVSHRGSLGWAEVQLEGKPMSQYSLNEKNALFYPILKTAIALANQTKVAKVEGLPSRHIPREVRQRVWQKYGGRCAECNATEYLEFDHVIPHSRGGSNAEGNIQLLCRMCNLKKSDFI